MRVLVRAAALLGLAALLPACGLGNGFQGFYVPFPNTVAAVYLRGIQVVPPALSASVGSATITVDGLRKFVDYTIDATGPTGVTAVEIRLGVPGTNGPAIFVLPAGPFPMTGRLLEADLHPQTGAATLAEAGDQIANGKTYLLISTGGYPAGEIRGHIGKALLASASLSGSQVVAPISTTATGTATVLLNDAQDQMTFALNFSGVTSPTEAHVFDGKPGDPGTSAIFDLATSAFTSPLTVSRVATDFTASAGVGNFTEAVNALLGGQLFVQVMSLAHPTGELRGQIGPTPLLASLNGSSVYPPNGSSAIGNARVNLDATQTAFFITMTHGVSSPTGVEIYAEDPTNGPLLFDVDAIAGAATSPLSATLTDLQLTQAPSKGITTFPEAVDALLTSKTYVQVRSAGFPGGEIRGLIVPY